MSIPLHPDAQVASTRPYLIRALHDWCTDNGFTPYLAVFVDASVQVPMEYVKNQEIVLNVGFEATSGLQLGNEFVEFKARFGGVPLDIVVPIDHVVCIYARENGQGMAFPAPSALPPAPVGPATLSAAPGPARLAAVDTTEADSADKPVEADVGLQGEPPAPMPPSGGRPSLKRIK